MGQLSREIRSFKGRLRCYKRLFDHDDSDIAVAALTATINLGPALPEGAVVIGVAANVTEDFSDGGASTFEADVGNASDADKFTPTVLDIDGGIADLGVQAQCMPAGGDQLKVKFTGNVNLVTLTSGKVLVQVWFLAADETTFSAP